MTDRPTQHQPALPPTADVPKAFSRRRLFHSAAALAAIPLAGGLAACAATSTSPGSTTSSGAPAASGSGGASSSAAAADPKNPFGVASGSKIDAVIFDGGYGVDYVEYAAKLLGSGGTGATATVSPSTQIATELQPRFVGGNPPDLIDNSGAGSIGVTSILGELSDLTDVINAPNLEGTAIKDTLYEGVLKPGTYGDKFVALNYVLTVYAVWYSSSLFEKNGWEAPTTWDEAKALGEKAKSAGKYLFVFGKEAATYYQTMAIESAIKQGGDEVRLALENLEADCWSKEPVQQVFTALQDIISAGFMKPGGSGTQFTQAQAQWSQDQAGLLYPSGSWIENEMKKQTASGFAMKGVPTMVVNDQAKLPKTALHSTAGEPFVVPSKAANPAGGKELLRIMLSKDAASNFAKEKLTSTIVKGLVPADGFGSTALVAQTDMLKAAGSDVFTFDFVATYGMNKDQLVLWNAFLEGKSSVAQLTEGLQKITDAVREDPSVTKIPVK